MSSPFAATLAAAFFLISGPAQAERGGTRPAAASGPPQEAYTPDRLAAPRTEQRPVFVNFTADAFQRTGVVYLKADWTSCDPAIATTLAEHGRAGVPLYRLYAPGDAEPWILRQILTPGTVTNAIDEVIKQN